MVCVGSSAVHQHTLHFIFFCSDALCHLPSRPSLRSYHIRHLSPQRISYITAVSSPPNLKKERKKAELSEYSWLSVRRQRGLSSCHCSCVHWGTPPISKQNMPWYISRLLWRALFFICTTERTLIKCTPLSSIWIVIIFLYNNNVEACATCIGSTLKQIYILFAFVFQFAIFLFFRSGRGGRRGPGRIYLLVFWGKSP